MRAGLMILFQWRPRADCIKRPIYRLGAVGEGLGPENPPISCADNSHYLQSEQFDHSPTEQTFDRGEERREEEKREENRSSARPAPRGGAGGAHAYMYR